MHLAAGYTYLLKKDFRLERQNPPLVKELLALPLLLYDEVVFNSDSHKLETKSEYVTGQEFLYGSALPAEKVLALGRLANLFLGTTLVALIGWWAYRLWGSLAGIVAMALACLEPNLIAHSSLVTTDIGVTLFIFLTTYLFWEYLRYPGWLLMCATGLSMGAALASKYSGILLLPIMFAILMCLTAGDDLRLFPWQENQRAKPNVFHGAGLLFLITTCASLTILPVYFFQGFQPWFSGLAHFLALAHDGQWSFFLGQQSYRGWWSYFLMAFLIKTPIASLILIATSIVLYRMGKPLRWREAVFLLAPVLVIFILTTQANVNIGLRHVLPVYPFLFVLASRFATTRFRYRSVAPSILAVTLGLTAASVLRIAPHQLAYFNEFVGGPEQGHRYLSDSNLDWGQDLKGLKQYLDKEKLPIIYLSYFGAAPPSYYGIRYEYVPGTWPLKWPPPADKVPATAPRKVLAISVCNLQDVGRPYDPLFRWLRKRSPVAKIGYSIFVYDLTNDPEGLKELHQTYAKAGIPKLR